MGDCTHLLARRRVAVVGCGIFGATVALRLAAAGARVTVFERCAEILAGASLCNQNRLHLGYHYPRDPETARQCAIGYRRFCEAFPGAVEAAFPCRYFVAESGSLTTPEAFLRCADAVGHPYSVLDLREVRPEVRGVALGIAVEEAVFDVGILREDLRGRLARAGVDLRLGAGVSEIARRGAGYALRVEGHAPESFDAAVNCTYADVGRLGEQLGCAPRRLQHEWTLIPVIEWSGWPVGITVMDGPFGTVLPRGRSRESLAYHVRHSVVETRVGDAFPWRGRRTSDAERWLVAGAVLAACAEHVPSIAGARVVSYLEGPRAVLPDRDATDARPSLVEEPAAGYLTVLAGKVDHCLDVADEVAKRLIQRSLT